MVAKKSSSSRSLLSLLDPLFCRFSKVFRTFARKDLDKDGTELLTKTLIPLKDDEKIVSCTTENPALQLCTKRQARLLLSAAFCGLCFVLSEIFVLLNFFHLLCAFLTCSGVVPFPQRSLLLPAVIQTEKDCLGDFFLGQGQGRRYWLYAFGLLFGLALSSVFGALESNFMGLLGLRLKSAALGAVWRRSLGGGDAARFDASGTVWCVQQAGAIAGATLDPAAALNCASRDARCLAENCRLLNRMWMVPLQTVLSIVLLGLILESGGDAFFAVAVFFGCAILPTLVLAVLKVRKSRQRSQVTEQRGAWCNEMLSGLKIIKFFAWESA